MYPVYLISLGLVYGVAWAVSPFSKKVREGLRGRRGLLQRTRAIPRAERPFWFHVASSGEFEQVIPILEALRIKEPKAFIYLSYFSPTARRAVELETERRHNQGRALPWNASDFAPIDFPRCVRRFIEALHPRCFVAIHREIWPSTLRVCAEKHIPCYLFGTYVSPNMQKRFRWMKRWLGYYDRIGTNNDATTKFLRELVPGKAIETLGDPRVERVLRRKESVGKPPGWRSFFAGQKIAIFASVWPEDFANIQDGLDELSRSGWRLLIVPHEVKGAFVEEIYRTLAARRIQTRLWSRWLLEPDGNSHLVVNAVGFLAELYQVAEIVFVGGSFRSRVHNVLEPAAYGKPILTGPFIENSGEAMEMLHFGLVRTHNATEFAQAIHGLIADETRRKDIGASLSRYLQERTGAGERYAGRL